MQAIRNDLRVFLFFFLTRRQCNKDSACRNALLEKINHWHSALPVQIEAVLESVSLFRLIRPIIQKPRSVFNTCLRRSTGILKGSHNIHESKT